MDITIGDFIKNPNVIFMGKENCEQVTFRETILDAYKVALEIFNDRFNSHMSVAVEEIAKEIKPLSIFLIGSFGRDEGSLYVSKEAVSPLRDYDILIIVNKPVESDLIKKVTSRIHYRVGFTDPFLREVKFRGFVFSLTQVAYKSLDALPLLKLYELKRASKLLWGKDIRNEICLRVKDLSKYNCMLDLFGQVHGFLGLVDIDTLRKKGRNEEAVDFVYQCSKTYVEEGTCLSLLTNDYEPSFLKRSARLLDSCLVSSRVSGARFRTLLPLIVRNTYRRLLIDDDYMENVDKVDLLVTTIRDLDFVIWFYIREAYRVNVPNDITAPHSVNTYVKELNTRILADLFDYYLKKRIGFRSTFLREMIINFYPKYTLVKFFIAGRKSGYQIKPQILLKGQANIMLKLWLLGLTLLNAVKRNLEIDETILHTVARELRETVDFGYAGRHLTIESSGKFSFLQKTIFDLSDIADRIFHRKG